MYNLNPQSLPNSQEKEDFVFEAKYLKFRLPMNYANAFL